MKRKMLMLGCVLLMGQASADTMAQLYQKVWQLQVPSTTTNTAPYQQPGLFQSWVHMNFVGGEVAKDLREGFKIYDNNYFVTAFSLNSIMQSANLNAYSVNPSAITNAVKAEMTFFDQNSANSAVMAFWHQRYINGYYEANPVNLENLFNNVDTFKNELVTWCEKKHSKDECNIINKAFSGLTNLQDSFHIPGDADDTAANLLLGANLYAAKEQQAYIQAYQLWRQHDSDAAISEALQLMVDNAYQPKTKVLDHNLIDPRTYYIMHSFLENYKDPAPAFVTTWVYNLGLEKKQLPAKPPYVAMPFNVNNVDISVASNFIYAITKMRIEGMLASIYANNPTLENEVNHVMQNSADFIAYSIEKGLPLSRPDMSFLYYPSKYNIYWFVGRIANQLNSSTNLTRTERYIQNTFNAALQRNGTQDLLNSIHCETQTNCYVDDFLGNGDKEPQYEDRTYTTAVVELALLNTWTAYNSTTKQYQWITTAPNTVKQKVAALNNWLNANAMDSSAENTFFSGSVKGMQSLPFVYPGNYFYDLDGTPIAHNWDSPMPDSPNAVVAMSGEISADAYAKELSELHFLFPTPKTFSGFNHEGDVFPYWSAPVISYSLALQALAMYEHTQ